MDLLTAKRTAELLLRLSGQKEEVAVLPMRVQKVPFASVPASTGRLPRCAPEAAGIPSGYLQEFLRCAAEDREGNLHSLTVLRHGKVIAACSFPPYDREIWHVSHSLCKTVTALAVGILMDQGALDPDERVTDIFAQKASPVARIRYRSLTVRHLLSMTSGASFSEISSAAQEDWVRGFLDSAPQFEPGASFQYNSMNTYMLSAAIREKTGCSLSAFLQAHLFGAMGIRRFHWETCPLGIEKGGWGLYLLPEDMAKLGQLVLNGGAWQGRQLVSRAYIREMCGKHSEPPKTMSDYGYGWQCWLWARPGSMMFNGLFGQNILVIPELDMVIVSTAGGDRMFGKSAFLSLCETYFGPRTVFPRVLPPDPPAFRSLRKYIRILEDPNLRGKPAERGLSAAFSRYQQHRFCSEQNLRINRNRYAVESGTARLLPLFVQIFENNYTSGISRIGFAYKGEELYMHIEEGTEKNTLAVGFSGPKRNDIHANGEVQTAAVSGMWARDEDGIPVLKLEIAFLEQSSTRYIKLFFPTPETIRAEFSERPSKQAVRDGASVVLGASRLLGTLSGAGQERFLARFDALAEPVLTGRLIRS
ncbi:MAG: serine hydrolase domain-containing protein [Hominenteromicrobium sp.]